MENKQEIVRELNIELYDKFKEAELNFSYSTTGLYESVSFGGNLIWHSEDDDRLWVEETNDYEPFKPFIERAFNKWVDELSRLKF